MSGPLGIMALLYYLLSNHPRLRHVDPISFGKKKIIFKPKLPSFALLDVINESLSHFIMRKPLLDFLLQKTLGMADGNKLDLFA